MERMQWYLDFLQQSKLFKIDNLKIADKQHLLLDNNAASQYIKKRILDDSPFLAIRMGANEARCAFYGVGYNRKYIRKIPSGVYESMSNNAGFFDINNEKMLKYTEMFEDTIHAADLLGLWNVTGENFFRTVFGTDKLYYTRICDMEPYYNYNNPWSEVLEGKKVVVIHPFAKTILEQYQKRTLLFPDSNILPEFELRVVQAVQTIAGLKDDRFDDWFEALDWMYRETIKEDFDIAIIGCGAYGMILAGMIKKYGKKAIHLGGATQIFFGIKGKRWDSIPSVSKLYNDNWVRPDIQDMSEYANKVEDGCYW